MEKNVISQEYDKKGYLLEDFHLFHLKDAKGTKMEFHYHEFCKLVFLISGHGGYTVEGKHYRLTAGDILFVGRHQIHRPEFEKGIEYERIILYIAPEFLKKQSAQACQLETLFSGEEGHVLRLDEKKYKKLFDLARSIEAETDSSNYGNLVMANSFLLRLLVEAGRNFDNNRMQSMKRPVTSDKRIKEILDYIELHFTEDLDIDELADQFYISRYHMMRLFKKETGQSIYEYLTEQRLFFARDLIRQGVSATESCFRAGFGSYSSFTRAYGKRFGMTPTGRNGRCIEMDEMLERR